MERDFGILQRNRRVGPQGAFRISITRDQKVNPNRRIGERPRLDILGMGPDARRRQREREDEPAQDARITHPL